MPHQNFNLFLIFNIVFKNVSLYVVSFLFLLKEMVYKKDQKKPREGERQKGRRSLFNNVNNLSLFKALFGSLGLTELASM